MKFLVALLVLIPTLVNAQIVGQGSQGSASSPWFVTGTVTFDNTSIEIGGSLPTGANTIGAVNLAQYTPNTGRLPVFADINGTVEVVQATGTNLHVVCDSGCGGPAAFADDDAFTFGTTSIGNVGYVVDDTSPNTVTENSAGTPRMSANRVPYSIIRDAAGNERGANVNASNELLTSSAVTTLPTLPSATDTLSATGSVTLSDVEMYGSAVVTYRGTYTGGQTVIEVSDDGTNFYGINTQCTGCTITEVGTIALATNQSVMYAVNLPGGVSHVRGRITGILTGSITVTVTAGLFSQQNVVNAITGDGAGLIVGINNSFSGNDPMKIEDDTASSGATGMFSLNVRNDGPNQLTNNSLEYSAMAVDAYGAAYSRQDHPNRIACNVLSTATTSTIVTGCSAPGAGLSIYLTSLQWHSSIISTTTNFMTIQSGTGGNCGASVDVLYRGYAQVAFSGREAVFQTPIKAPANEEICLLHPGAGTRLVSIQGFIAP